MTLTNSTSSIESRIAPITLHNDSELITFSRNQGEKYLVEYSKTLEKELGLFFYPEKELWVKDEDTIEDEKKCKMEILPERITDSNLRGKIEHYHIHLKSIEKDLLEDERFFPNHNNRKLLSRLISSFPSYQDLQTYRTNIMGTSSNYVVSRNGIFRSTFLCNQTPIENDIIKMYKFIGDCWIGELKDFNKMMDLSIESLNATFKPYLEVDFKPISSLIN